MAARKTSAGDEIEAEPFIEPDDEEKLHKGMGWKRAAFTMMAEIVGTGVLGLSHAAAKVGAPLHVYAISSHCSDLDGGDGEYYGITYLGQEPPPSRSLQ